MENKTIAIVAVVIIGLGFVLGVTVNGGETDDVDLTSLKKEIVSELSKQTGAFPSPNILSDYLTYNGREVRYPAVQNFRKATSTVCSFVSPNATSTLTYAGISSQTGTSTALTLYIAKAANTNSTTTLLGGTGIAANARYTSIASTTPTVGIDDKVVFAPNQNLNFNLKGGASDVVFRTSDSVTGVCHAEFSVF